MNRNQKSVAFQVDGTERASNSNSNLNSNLNDLRHSESPSAIHKSMSECCYSISNLALIIASVVAITVLIQFLQDDPLYEYGEYLLTLRFYRQLIYMLVILPLVLLIPLFNATSAFCLSSNSRYDQVGRSILTAKTFFQFLMLILVFVALVLVAPSIRTSSLASQIELEIRKHMRWRYENQFSYEFLDRLQEEYECCDELWYRANMNDHLPSSCFVHGSNFGLIHDETCSEAIGSIVSLRCAIIAACLVVILVALACLVAIDIIELLTTSSGGGRQSYDFRANEAKLLSTPGGAGVDDDSGSHRSSSSVNSASLARQNHTPSKTIECANYLDANKRALVGQTVRTDEELPSSSSLNRLRSSERQRDQPLLTNHHLDDFDDDDDNDPDQPDRRPSSRTSSDRGHEPGERNQPPTILTRANYNQIERDRSQSPVFLGSTIERQTTTTTTSTCLPQRPIKSALKKTPSSQRLESTSSSSNSLVDVDGSFRSQRRDSPVEPDADSLLDYAEKLRTNSASLIRRQQEQQKEIQLHQTKRSLLNVRFADQ